MAVYYTLAIDCGNSHETAERIAAHYREFEIRPPDVSPIPCDVWVEQKLGIWRVIVWPLGLGHFCPFGPDRPEITTPEIMQYIQGKLYKRLSDLNGYRAAWFGHEAQDTLEVSELPEGEELALVGMVYAENLVDSEFFKSQPVFCDGYRWIPE